MSYIFLNNIVPNNSVKIPYNYINEIKEVLSIIESKIDKINIVKMTVYFTTHDCYDDIYYICNEWKPNNLEIEYIGYYMNYNPLIHVMASVIANSTIHYKTTTDNKVNYII
jgi:hypothetical protein